MSLITINQQKCTQCNACVESCPLLLFNKTDEKSFPVLPEINESRCIYCGHCEAVCPNHALTHQLSEHALNSVQDKVRDISQEELGVYFKSRRSIRQFKAKTIDSTIIEKVMDVVRYAPTGSNRQLNHWIVISDTSLIQKLAASTIDWMKQVMKTNQEMASRLGIPLLIASWEKGNDRICRNAPHLFIAYAPSSYPLGIKDTVIAASHLELLLPSYGLGGCWAGYLMVAFQQSPETKKLIGLDDTYAVHATLMAGYPKYKYQRIPARNASKITWL
jgi:nitroreductase/NAD-dependent dihydropyrimidine dehydrogenase PreA subunit